MVVKFLTASFFLGVWGGGDSLDVRLGILFFLFGRGGGGTIRVVVVFLYGGFAVSSKLRCPCNSTQLPRIGRNP